MSLLEDYETAARDWLGRVEDLAPLIEAHRDQMEAALRVWQIWLFHRHLCHIGRAARVRSEFQSSPLH